MASTVAITVPQGNDVTVDLAVYEADEVTPQNLTALSAVMVIKASRNATDTNATELGTGTGLTWVDQAQGTLTALLPHTLLATAGYLWWRLDITDESGDRTTAMDGPLIIEAV